MRKKRLLELIAEYDATKKGISIRALTSENYRITLLKKFMAEPDIQILTGRDTIPLEKLEAFVDSNLKDKEKVKQFFSKDYLEGTDKSAALFRELKATSRRKDQPLSFGPFPDEIPKHEIIPQVDEIGVMVRLSQASSSLYSEISGGLNYWKKIFIKAGMDPMLIAQLGDSGIRNFKNLARAFNVSIYGMSSRRPYDDDVIDLGLPCYPNELWQLQCLSGDRAAIAVASTDHSIQDRLPYLCLSGNPDIIDDIINEVDALQLPSVDKAKMIVSIFQYTAASGSIVAMEHLIKVSSTRFSDEEMIEHFANLFSRHSPDRPAYKLMAGAVQSGSKAMIDCIDKFLNDLKYNPNFSLDNPFNYRPAIVFIFTAMSGRLDTIKHVMEKIKSQRDSEPEKTLSRWGDSNKLIFAAVQSGKVEMLDYVFAFLKEKNIPVKQQEIHSKCVKHAFLSGSEQMIDRVLSLDPAYKATDIIESMLYGASRSGNVSSLRRAWEFYRTHDPMTAISPVSYGMFLLHAAEARSAPAILFIRQQCKDIVIPQNWVKAALDQAKGNTRLTEALKLPLEELALKSQPSGSATRKPS